jgi:hypothetical protein
MKWDWKDFLLKALIRAIRTFAQTFAAALTVGALWTEVQWIPALSAAGVAFVYSILMSLATGLPEVDKQPPDINDGDPENEIPEE